MAIAVCLAARYLKSKTDSNHLIKLRELSKHVMMSLDLRVYTSMMARAKNIVLKDVEGNLIEEYAALMGYRDLLKRNASRRLCTLPTSAMPV
ncbi:hypothetical protein SLE2022_213160 [Rubroshorea leprosula]